MRIPKIIELEQNGQVKKINQTDWRVEKEFKFLMDGQDQDYYVIVPEGFITDFGSIPWLFRNFFDYMQISYILHDYLYSKGAKICKDNVECLLSTREEADFACYYSLINEDYGKIKSIVVLYILRLFGWTRFQKEKKKYFNN